MELEGTPVTLNSSEEFIFKWWKKLGQDGGKEKSQEKNATSKQTSCSPKCLIPFVIRQRESFSLNNVGLFHLVT